MTGRSLLIFAVTVILLAGCGSPPFPGEPVSGAPRRGSVLTPVDGAGSPSPAGETATETKPLSLIESATQTALAELATAAETKDLPPTAEEIGEPTQKNTIAASTKETAANPAASKTAQPTATKSITGPSATPAPSKSSAPSEQASKTPDSTATFTEAPTPVPANTSTPGACSPGVDSAYENEVVSLINAERSKAGLSPLTKQSQLTAAARLHSQDMACNDFFSHTSPTTGSPFDRIAAQGYSYSWAGENIAAGYGSAAALVQGWMNSPGHKANILSENFTQIGVGYAYWAGSTYGSYSTAVFAKP